MRKRLISFFLNTGQLIVELLCPLTFMMLLDLLLRQSDKSYNEKYFITFSLLMFLPLFYELIVRRKSKVNRANYEKYVWVAATFIIFGLSIYFMQYLKVDSNYGLY